MPRTTLRSQREGYRCEIAGCSVRWGKISSTMVITVTTILTATTFTLSTPTNSTLNVTSTARALRHRPSTSRPHSQWQPRGFLPFCVCGIRFSCDKAVHEEWARSCDKFEFHKGAVTSKDTALTEDPSLSQR